MSREAAAQAMRAAGLRAPLPCDDAEQIAAHGQCFELRTESGVGVFVLRRKGDVLWIDGAGRIEGGGLTEPGIALIREVARRLGCRTVAFETARRGLVRRARKLGARVAGVIMEMDAQ